MQPFFSVIMPVYNSEKYVTTAIESILNQTYGNFELIVVDDCSSDNSREIIEKLSEYDERIRLCSTKVNLGVANARNEAIKMVTGKYLTFVDADDCVEPDLFCRIKNIINKTKAQLIKYGIIEEYFSNNGKLISRKYVTMPDKIFTNYKDVRKSIVNLEAKPLFGYLCNSFYSLNVLPKNIWNFDLNLQVNEDFVMNMKIIEKINCMVYMNYCGYHYNKRVATSLTTRRNDDYFKYSRIKIELLRNKYRKWNLYNENERMEILWLFIRIIFSAIARTVKYSGYKQAKLLYINICKDDLFICLKNECSSYKYKSLKKILMTKIIMQKNTFVLLLIVKMICLLKDNMPFVFAKIKE